MSNPTINRWGSNSIWYHFWYADTAYAKQVNQDKIFSQLIEIYLIYGLESHYHHFNNIYWFRKPRKCYPAHSYFRSLVLRKEAIGMETKYRLRVGVEDVYKMRIWILRYNRWFIINMYWFQPYKKRPVVGKIISKIPRNYVSLKKTTHTTSYQRLLGVLNLTNVSKLSVVQNNSVYVF